MPNEKRPEGVPAPIPSPFATPPRRVWEGPLGTPIQNPPATVPAVNKPEPLPTFGLPDKLPKARD
jgi:hypothetical protein